MLCIREMFIYMDAYYSMEIGMEKSCCKCHIKPRIKNLAYCRECWNLYAKNYARINKPSQKYKDKRNKRLRNRKLEYVKLKGGKCCKCGYKKNISALCFHHIEGRIGEFENPQSKKFDINRVNLMCDNCHKEEHHPELNMIGT